MPPNPVTQEQRDSTIGLNKYPIYKLLLGKAIPDLMLETLETDQPYPIRFVWIFHTSTITPTNTAQPSRWHDALQKMDFIVVADVIMSETAEYADIVLPASFWFENTYV